MSTDYKLAERLEWGTLTGVRPSKLYRKIFSDVDDKYLTRKILKELYLLSDNKIDILEEVYENQRQTMAKDYDFINYVSLPFCPSKCSYCTFTTGLGAEYRGSYLKALLAELDAGKEFFCGAKIVYVGGGTPTYLEDEQLEALLKVLASYSTYDEFTVEAGRPDTITEEKLNIMKAYGIDRISINPQSFNQKTLLKVNRNHSVEEIYKVYDLAVKKGFKNINMDLILGLPSETLEDVEHSAKTVCELEPSSVTAHCLAIKKNNHLPEKYLEEHTRKNEEINQMMLLLSNHLAKKNYEKYYIYRQKNIGGNGENIGFCKNGYESAYNILMMEDMSNVYAFGAGAISRVNRNGKISRLAFPKSIKDYIDRLDELIQKKHFFVQNAHNIF